MAQCCTELRITTISPALPTTWTAFAKNSSWSLGYVGSLWELGRRAVPPFSTVKSVMRVIKTRAKGWVIIGWRYFSSVGKIKAMKSNYLRPLSYLIFCTFSHLKIKIGCTMWYRNRAGGRHYAHHITMCPSFFWPWGKFRFVKSRLLWINEQLSFITNLNFAKSHCETYLDFF